MKKIKLVAPQMKYKDMILDYKKEHFDYGEDVIHGASLLDKKDTYEEWLLFVQNNQNEDTLPKDWMVSSTYLAINHTEDSVIGMIDIRHELNDALRNYGGHIGYSIRPTQRKKGYATQMLQLALEVCKKLNIKNVMLACDKHNEGSRRTILKCGGILEKEFKHDNEEVQVYWIEV